MAVNASDAEFIAGVRGTLLDCWKQQMSAREWSGRTLHITGGGVYGGAASALCEILLSRLHSCPGVAPAMLMQYIDEAIRTLVPFSTWFKHIRAASTKASTKASSKASSKASAKALLTMLHLVDTYKGALFGAHQQHRDEAASPSLSLSAAAAAASSSSSAKRQIHIDTHASTVHAEAQQLYEVVMYVSEAATVALEEPAQPYSGELAEKSLAMLAALTTGAGALLRLFLHVGSVSASASSTSASAWSAMQTRLTRLHRLVGGSSAWASVSAQRLCVVWTRLQHCVDMRRVSAADAAVDLSPLHSLQPHTLANTHVSHALFARLHEFMRDGGAASYAQRLQSLRLLYGQTYHQLYVDVMASHIRVCHQTSESRAHMQSSSVLLVVLPQAIKALESGRGGRATPAPPDEPNDVELALAQLVNFHALCAAEFAEGVTWLDVLVDAMCLHGLARVSLLRLMLPETMVTSTLFESFALALPPPVAHGDAVMCSDLTELDAVLSELCAADAGGSSLSADFVLHLVDLSFGRQTWCHRVQHVVVTKLVPRLLQTDFELPLLVLDAVLLRLGSQACLAVLLMHGVLPQVVASLLTLWRLLCSSSDDADGHRLRIDVLSRCQYLLLHVLTEYPHLGTPDAADFLALAQGMSSKALHPDRHKTIAQRVVNVSGQASPQSFTWADGLRKACVNVAPEDVLLTVRFVILPNMYTKIVEQDKYRSFLGVLVEAMPFVGSGAVEYVCSIINEDLQGNKSIAKHLPIVECLLGVADKLELPLMSALFRRRLCACLSLSKEPDTVKAVAAAFGGGGYMASLAKNRDRSALLQKHADYLLRSHTSYMSASWKDMAVHRPVLVTCLQQLGKAKFLSMLTSLLVGSAGKTLRVAELIVAMMAATDTQVASSPTSLVHSLCVDALPTLVPQHRGNSEVLGGLAVTVVLTLVIHGLQRRSDAGADACLDAVHGVIVADLERQANAVASLGNAEPSAGFGEVLLSMLTSLARPNNVMQRLPREKIVPLLETLSLDALAAACHPLHELDTCKHLLARLPLH